MPTWDGNSLQEFPYGNGGNDGWLWDWILGGMGVLQEFLQKNGRAFQIAMSQEQQKADLEQQERRFYEIAGRLHSLVMMGAFDIKDFEDTLYGFGILTEWKRSHT